MPVSATIPLISPLQILALGNAVDPPHRLLKSALHHAVRLLPPCHTIIELPILKNHGFGHYRVIGVRLHMPGHKKVEGIRSRDQHIDPPFLFRRADYFAPILYTFQCAVQRKIHDPAPLLPQQQTVKVSYPQIRRHRRMFVRYPSSSPLLGF